MKWMTLNSMKEPPNVKFELQGRAAEAGICDFLIGCESVLGGGERGVTQDVGPST